MTNPTDNPKMFIGHYVDYDTEANYAADAIKKILPNAYYSHTLNPYCLVFYDNQFGNVFVKSGE
jgi:hypothetical protein